MDIHCDACGAVVPATDIDLNRNIAKCAACNNVFNCKAQLDGLGPGARERPQVELPRGMEMFTRSNGLRIVRRWFGAKVIALTFFCIFWDGFMITWYAIAITKKVWPMAAFGLLHAAVGIGLTYYVIAGFLNRTVITVLNGRLNIDHGPIPVPGKLSMSADELDQLYAKRKVSHSRNGGTSVSYELHARLTGGQDRKLLGGLTKEEHALFIEQQIESFLGIEDRAVSGEVEG
jgi:hypothetical protein